ncbi:MAG: hypothetical protein IPP42_07450 [Saprospiraceae bacterium]|nr:hypothetical protein [Saprospiraceae bacterium]
MYLSYKLQYTYQFTIDSPTTFWQIESGSFKYKEKLMGHYESKLSKAKGNTNPQQRSFVILQLNFLRRQKGWRTSLYDPSGRTGYDHTVGEWQNSGYFRFV